MVASATKAVKRHLRGKGFTAVYFPLLIPPSSQMPKIYFVIFTKWVPSLLSQKHAESRWGNQQRAVAIPLTFPGFLLCLIVEETAQKVANAENQNHCPWIFISCFSYRIHSGFCQFM